jgi:RalA-binding protein 1
LLKSFLRELPTSILTRDLHLQFLAVIGKSSLSKIALGYANWRLDFADPQERIRELSHLISQLPVANYSLLRALTAHLINIVQNAPVNKMTMRNVGIVFSPTLGIPAGVFSLMLGEFTRVFNVNDGVEEGAPAEETPEPSPQGDRAGVDRRNSQRYTDAAADKLLGLSGRQLGGT